MDFIALLHRTATAFGGFHQFAGQTLTHRLLGAFGGGFPPPAHRQRGTARWPDFDGDLIVGPAHAAAFHFDHRLDVLHGLAEDFDRLFAGALLDDVEGAVDDALGHRLLAGNHEHIDELRDLDV